MSETFSPLFGSHGAPDLAIRATAAHAFLKSYGAETARPRAILMVSAHFETDGPTLVTDPAPGMIYDFGGFDPQLRTMVYPAPGAPDVAARAFDLLAAARFEPRMIEKRGYDHGVWVPLMLLYPEADIPVAPLVLGLACPHRRGSLRDPPADDGIAPRDDQLPQPRHRQIPSVVL